MLHAFNKNLGGLLFKFISKLHFFFTENIRGRRDFQKSGGGTTSFPLPLILQ